MRDERDELKEVLGALGQEHREVAAPAELEMRLRAAAGAREREGRPGDSRRWVWGVGMAAALLMLGAALWTARVMERKAPGQLQANSGQRMPTNGTSGATEQGSVQETPERPGISKRGNAGRANLRRKRGTDEAARTNEAMRESGTTRGFVALPGSEGLPDPMEASVVRVQLAKGELRQYGFDVPPAVAAERIRADFFMGDDGLPRAIRLVR